MLRLALIALALSAAGAARPLSAQVPDAPLAPAAQGAPKPENTTLGQAVPFLDPGSEVITWDGKHWNINDNRLFGARFEKYLNAEAETAAAAGQYRQIVTAILARLSPYQITPAALDEAFRLLPRASSFAEDANLSDALASSVYSVWQARREDGRLVQANDALAREQRAAQWNAQMSSTTVSLSAPPRLDPKTGGAQAVMDQWASEQQMKRDLAMQPHLLRLAEIKALTLANRAKRELSALQTKVEFQALILQFFLQRRFEHVLMATGFYRAMFGEGDTTLKLQGDAKKLFDTTTGLPPTVSVLDSLAREAMRDAREGVEAYRFLLTKDELESAAKRLAEAFAIGEYLPELRTLSRADKRQALAFTQKSNQLLSALEVKDFTLAAGIVQDLAKTARDFDNSKPMAAIETARTVAAMHLAKARNAAVSNDRAALETELRAATEIWPRNPALSELSATIFSQADVQQKALVDFDQLLAQHNYRQIYEDQMRYIAAVALSPERAPQLKQTLAGMATVEGAILRSQEIAKRGDKAGAWEAVERVFTQFPDDNKLNQVRATLTTEAAEFVRTLRTAEGLEAKGQYGSSLAWYLKAQEIYPASEYASEGVGRLVKQVLPES